MATTHPDIALPFRARILAAATGSVTTPCLPDLALPANLAPRVDRWIAADLATKGVVDITGSLDWWKATLRQLDAELVITTTIEEDETP